MQLSAVNKKALIFTLYITERFAQVSSKAY